jgi:hypothetical protein
MLRVCLSGGFRRFLPLTLEEGSTGMSQYHQQQRSIRTTIPCLKKIIELIEDEVLGIKIPSSTRGNCILFALELEHMKFEGGKNI